MNGISKIESIVEIKECVLKRDITYNKQNEIVRKTILLYVLQKGLFIKQKISFLLRRNVYEKSTCICS